MVNIERLKEEGFTFEEIQKVKDSIEDFKKTGISYTHAEVKQNAREELFSNVKQSV